MSAARLVALVAAFFALALPGAPAHVAAARASQ